MRYLLAPFLLITLLVASIPAEDTKFMRIDRWRGKAMTLDTAIVRYEKNGTTVDLVSAIHIGQRSYYKDLNTKFKDYDVVLYELVGPKGSKPDKDRGTDSENPIHMVQELAKTFLGLEHQLALIDYTSENFVHADMSPLELFAKMSKTGDTPFTLFLSTWADMIRQQNLEGQKPKFKNANDIITDEELMVGLLQALLTEKGSPTLRRYLALQLGENMDEQMRAFGGPLGSLLIKDRNEACFKVLDKQIAAGKKRIAIFYGAGHMPDMETRLIDGRDFKKRSVEWLVAWELR